MPVTTTCRRYCLYLAALGGLASMGFNWSCGTDDAGEKPPEQEEEQEQLCGNGVIDPGEECDGDELGDASCQELGFYRGELLCDENCLLDSSGCEAYCGDGLVHSEHGEECDGANLDGLTDCAELGYTSGALSCDAGCRLDKSACVSDWSCGDLLVDARDGQQYPTVLLGEQCWLASNLNVGMMVSSTSNTQSDTQQIEKYCLYNEAANCALYGGLYRWQQAMAYATEEGARGICPEGWYLPSDADWKELELHLGMSQADANSTGWRGAPVGTALKVDGESGFEGKLAGLANSAGSFGNYPSYGYFWTSSLSNPDNSASNPWRRCLTKDDTWYDPADVARYASWPGSYALSLRCVLAVPQG